MIHLTPRVWDTQLVQQARERGWHRTAAGKRADVLSRRARASPAPKYSDAQLAMQDPPLHDALAPVQARVRAYAPHLLMVPVRLAPTQPIMRLPRLRRRPLLLTQLTPGRSCSA